VDEEVSDIELLLSTEDHQPLSCSGKLPDVFLWFSEHLKDSQVAKRCDYVGGYFIWKYNMELCQD